MAGARQAGAPLWPLPLAIAVLLVVAVHLAWWLSLRAGYVPACIPYLEGCTSISRAARHGFGNHVFRLLALPATALMALHWWASARWLALRGAGSGGRRWLLALGIAAAVALAVYATFLGTEGATYRFMRRHGVVVYFGASYLAQLVFLRAAIAAGAVPARVRAAMLAVCASMLALGIGYVAVVALADAAAKDRFENLLEWHLAVLLMGWYLLQAWLWRCSGDRLAVLDGGGRPPP